MKRIDVAIASPGDLSEEREVVPRLFNRWNENNSQAFLHPVMWESASVPAMGDHPQHLLNEKIIDRSDLLVAMLWYRLGTPTPTAPSGTVEEIREFIRRKGAKRVMLYFCTRNLPYNIDPADLAKLQEFKADMKSQGLYHEYGTVEQFERDLFQHLGAKVRELLEDKLPIPEPVAEESQERGKEPNEHPDPRLRGWIEFGTSLEEISDGFARRMDDFDAIDGGGPDKFLDLAAHVYRSVAKSLDRFLTFSSAELSEQDKRVLERISTHLKELWANCGDYLKRPFPQYWTDSRQICDDLRAHVCYLSHNARKVR